VRRLVLTLVVLMAAGVLSLAAETRGAPPVPGEAGLQRLRSMAGDWYEIGPDGQPTDELVSRVSVTSGGNAVHELHFPGQPHEMLTVYYLEEGELTLVHYCVLANRPKMRASEITDDALAFTCAGLEDESQSHMHAARIVSVAPGHNHVEWVNWDGGRRDHAIAFDLVRK